MTGRRIRAGKNTVLAIVGSLLAILIGFGISAQTQLFSDDFQDGNANGWTRSSGSWSVVTDGSLAYRQSSVSADSNARAGAASANYAVQARVKPIAFNGADRYVGVMARVVNSNHYYFLALQNGNRLLLGKRAGSSPITLATRSFPFSTGTFYTLRIEANGSSLSGYVNGALQLTASDSEFTSGIIGGATYFASASFDDFLVTSIGGGTPTPTPTPTPAPIPPVAPTGLMALAGSGQVTLTWNGSPGANSYNVKRSTTNGGPYATIASGVTGLSFTNTGLSDGTTYFYVVSAVNSFGESGNSTQASATPVQPGPGEIFVAPNGTDSNPGTINAPTTLSAAITRIQPGQTIQMRGGTYNFSTTITIARGNNGTASQPKNLFAYNGERPILNFSAQSFSSSNRGIQLNGFFWHLRGLEVMGAGDNGIFIGGNNNIIELCVTHHNRDSGLQLSRHSSSAPESEWPSNNLILNCVSFDNFDPDDGEDADGFACKLTAGPGNVFRGCIAHHNIDDGWDLFTNDDTGEIGAVTIENCIAYNNGTLSTGGTTTDSDGNGFKLGGEDIAVNHVVRRSIAFGNKKHGFTFNRNNGSITMTNNTSWGNGEENFKFDQGSHIFTNNLSFQGTNSDHNAGGSDVSNTNCWWQNGRSVNGKGLVVSAADFVSLTPTIMRNADGSINLGNFLRLAPGSDLINAGVPSGTDIGAVESQ